ncbi:hypothetical protein ACH5RR_014263 [Cinchona calisaya]|uniref:Uncharacterized protein n=1 Tax=Cinchona calisaya TaxID=153742 RepID=A0ABD3A2C7_9GENT
MGTQILHSKRYSTGYCSIWGLNANVSNDTWSLYHEDKAPKSGYYGDSFLPRHMTINGSLEFDKEKLRQTILKHESMFKHQLQELHRLYGRQKELMNVFRIGDPKKSQMKTETSNLSPSFNIPSEDAIPTRHATHTRSLHLGFGQSSTSESAGKKSFSGFIKDKSMLAFPSRWDGISETCEPPHSNRNLLGRGIIDLESPPNVNMNHEEIHLKERIFELSGVKSNSATSTSEILHDREIKLPLFSGVTYLQNDDGLRSSLRLKRKNEFTTDLNDPILLEETSVSGSADNPGTVTFSLDNRQRADLSATSNSILYPMWKDASLSSISEMNGGTCLNSLQSTNERNRKEQLAYDFKAKLMRPDTHSVITDGCPRVLPDAFESSQAEQRTINEFSTSKLGKTESKIKRKLFGVDIFEGHDESVVTHTNMINCTRKSDELSSKPSFLQDKESVDSSRRSSFSCSVDGVSYQNGLSLCPQLNAKHSKGNSAVDCNFSNNASTNALAHKVSPPSDLVNTVEGIECLDWRSAKVMKTASMTSNVLQDNVAPENNNILSADCPCEQKILMGSPVYLTETEYFPEQTRANKNSYHLNLDSLQNNSQQFFKTTKVTSLSSQILTDKRDTTLPLLIQENEERNTEVDECSSPKMNSSFLTRNELRISNDLSFVTEHPCLAADRDNDLDVEVEKVGFGDQTEGKDLNLEEQINNSPSCLRCHIDLNLSFIEEEAPTTPCLPTAIVKLVTTEIDLEVPVLLESEEDKGMEMSSDGGKEPYEELIRLAAEAIVAISGSGPEEIVNDTTRDSLEDTSNDSLKWFVDIVSSYECHDQSNMDVINLSGDGAFTVDLNPDGMDDFEFMTLKLKDAKSENYFYNYEAPILDNQEAEESKVTSLSRRPRRGQARRGRQPKDFQRDILPSLISLSKLEMTEDFQTFEELLRASGCARQSSLSRKRAAKIGRGRQRSGVMPSSQKPDGIHPPLEQKPVSRELELEDKILTGWGKRTRRLPRQRYMTGANASL